MNWCQRPIHLTQHCSTVFTFQRKQNTLLTSGAHILKQSSPQKQRGFSKILFLFLIMYTCVFFCVSTCTQMQCPQSLEDIRSLGIRVIGGGDVGCRDQTEVLRAHLSNLQSFPRNKSKEMNHKLCRLRF